MENWHPLTGKIPADPLGASWHGEPGGTPSKIIRDMRKVWHLVNGGTPEYAQELFDKAGAWVDYWLTARDVGRAHINAGVRGVPSAGLDTAQKLHAAATQFEAERRGLVTPETDIKADVLPDSEVAPTAILVIYAARQAVLAGRPDLLEFARDKGAHVARAGNAIEQQTWRRNGGESRKGKYSPIRRAVIALAKELGTKKFEDIFKEMQLDASTDDDGDSMSEKMNDIRSSTSDPINVRFQEMADDHKDREGVVRYSANGKEKTIKIGALQNYVSKAR